jgi:hypothetical protein
VEASVDPVINLHQNGRRDDERLVRRFDEPATGGVVGVASIK